METVVGVEGNDKEKFEDSEVEKFSSTTTSPNQIADSVVYKLVRVEGDGRFVPATDEEVMEVADLLENDKSTVHIVEDSGQTVACISNDGSSSGKSHLESSEGLSQPANTELDAARLNARLERFHLSGSGLADEDVKKAVGVHNSEPAYENENENTIMKAGYTTDPIEQLVIAEPENKPHSVVDMIEVGQNAEPKQLDSSGETSGDNINIATVPTAKGGMRRKHHRAWTLSEVMKLVEGVSRYGAGRWSEIKRLDFASYSHRTSVDLKDKWRNLLKASFAQTPPDKGVNSRKNASMPIPAPILLRVRELAEMHAPNVGPNKIAGCGGRSLPETKSGFL